MILMSATERICIYHLEQEEAPCAGISCVKEMYAVTPNSTRENRIKTG